MAAGSSCCPLTVNRCGSWFELISGAAGHYSFEYALGHHHGQLHDSEVTCRGSQWPVMARIWKLLFIYHLVSNGVPLTALPCSTHTHTDLF